MWCFRTCIGDVLTKGGKLMAYLSQWSYPQLSNIRQRVKCICAITGDMATISALQRVYDLHQAWNLSI